MKFDESKQASGQALEQEFCRRLTAPDMAPLLAREKTLVVALSGGGDSLALTLLAKKWCDNHGKRLLAAHVNHGLRPTAGVEAAQLQKTMAKGGVEVIITDLPNFGHKKNLSHRARVARYAALRAMAVSAGARVVLLAHQENDLAENFFIRLGRRAGLGGLAAMADVVVQDEGTDSADDAAMNHDHIYFLRPLLWVGRGVLQDYVKEQGLQFFDDPSNSDDRFLRARVRKWLAQESTQGIFNPADVAATARHLRAANNFAVAMAMEKKSTVLTQYGNMVVLRRYNQERPTNPLGEPSDPFLLHYWLRRVMQGWQGAGESPADFLGGDFPPPQDQVEKILAVGDGDDSTEEVVFDYPDYYIVADGQKILVIKKLPTTPVLVPPQKKIRLAGVYDIDNRGAAPCWVVAFGRGKDFLNQEWIKKAGIKNDAGQQPPAPVQAHEWLTPTTSRYFYANQPRVFWQENGQGVDDCLPTLGLYRHAGQRVVVITPHQHIA